MEEDEDEEEEQFLDPRIAKIVLLSRLISPSLCVSLFHMIFMRLSLDVVLFSFSLLLLFLIRVSRGLIFPLLLHVLLPAPVSRGSEKERRKEKNGCTLNSTSCSPTADPSLHFVDRSSTESFLSLSPSPFHPHFVFSFRFPLLLLLL